MRPPETAFCLTCNARERVILAGRCIVCEQPPDHPPAEREAVKA